MTDLKLFRTGTGDNKTMWYYEENPRCDYCDREIISPTAGFIVQWIKKIGRRDTLLHENCLKHFVKHPHCVAQYRWGVLMTDSMPPRSIPVFIQPPSLSPQKNSVSVFETDKIVSDKETDNAWRSKRFPSIEGATVGNQLAEKENLENDKAIERDPVSFLLEQKKLSQKAKLEHKGKVMLE